MIGFGAPAAAILTGRPLVTVVVLAHDQRHDLDACLRSIRAQTHTELEVLVLDDGPTDPRTSAIAAAHAATDPRFQALQASVNLGTAHLRNRGIELATGDLITFVDGDDLLPPTSIAARVAALERQLRDAPLRDASRVAAMYGDWRHVGPHEHTADHPSTSAALAAIDLASSRGNNVFTVTAPLVRTDVLRATGGFPEPLRGGEDHLAWVRILAAGGVFLGTEQVVHLYRQRPNSTLRFVGGDVVAAAAAARLWIDQGRVPHDEPLGARRGTGRHRRFHEGDSLITWGKPHRNRTRASATGLPGRGAAPPRPSASTDAPWPTRAPGPLTDAAGGIGARTAAALASIATAAPLTSRAAPIAPVAAAEPLSADLATTQLCTPVGATPPPPSSYVRCADMALHGRSPTDDLVVIDFDESHVRGAGPALVDAVMRARQHAIVAIAPEDFADPARAARFVAAATLAGAVVSVDQPERLQTHLSSPLAAAIDPARHDDLGIDLGRAATDPIAWSAASAAMRRASWASRPGARPSISVLLASKRPDMVGDALARIGDQRVDGAEIEVLVALHGFDETRALRRQRRAMPFATTVVEAPKSHPLGLVLAGIAERASADLVTKWDDDDLYSPHHLADMSVGLAYSGADVVGRALEWVHDAASQRTVLRNHGRHERLSPHIAGGTMTLRRALLDDLGGFDPLATGVDLRLKERAVAAGMRIYRMTGHGFVLVRHGRGHTWAPPAGWFDRSVDATFDGIPAIAGVGAVAGVTAAASGRRGRRNRSDQPS